MSVSSRIRGWVAKARALAGTPAGQQVARFARLAAVTAATAWIGGGHVLSTSAVWGAVVGGVEVAYRQWRQTVSVSEATVTVVPEPDPVPVPDPVSVSAPASSPEVSPEAVPADPVPDVPQDPSQGL